MKQKGLSLVEVLAAALIMAITLVGGVTALQFASNRVASTQTVLAAGLIAQAEIERAKVFGYGGLPYGTVALDSNGNVSGPGTWSGALDATANAGTGGWVSGATTYYTMSGVQTTSGSTSAAYSLTTSITDSGANQVLPSTTGTNVSVPYTLDLYAQRYVNVTVKSLHSNLPVLSQGTIIVKGGI